MGIAKVQGKLWSARATDWADVQESTVRPVYLGRPGDTRRAAQRKGFIKKALRRLCAIWLRGLYPADTPYRRLPYL